MNKEELLKSIKKESLLDLIREIKNLLIELKEDSKSEIDFSILNNKYIFYMRDSTDNSWLFIGQDPFDKKVNFYSIEGNYTGCNFLTNRELVTELRKATVEEIVLYRKHYSVKQKIWIVVYKNNNKLSVEKYPSLEDLNCGLYESERNGFTTLEIIEKEY